MNRRTEVQVIDKEGNEHVMLPIWHVGTLEVRSDDERTCVCEWGESDEEWVTLASFPPSFGVLLNEEPGLAALCTNFARQVAEEVGTEKDEPGMPWKNMSEVSQEILQAARGELESQATENERLRARVAELEKRQNYLESQAVRLKGELDQMREAYAYPRQHMAAEARRILDSEVRLDGGEKTLVFFNLDDDRPGRVATPPSCSYAVDHDNEMKASWRIVAFLVRELRKLAEEGE